jgi:hypothetical protein
MTGYFMPEPSLHLPDKESLLHALDHLELWHSKPYPFGWQVRSQFLIDIIVEIMARENRSFAYNAEVRVRAHELLGLPPISYAAAHNEGNPLSQLIYNAQSYHSSEELVAAGLEPYTSELLERAAKMKAKVQIGRYLCTPKQVNGKWYAFKPRARTNAFMPNGAPVKIVVG